MENILITGGRSGIIKKVIDKVKNEYNLYITVHTESELKAIKKIYKNYPNIKCFKLDIKSQKAIKKIDNLNIDILICNAATMESGSLIDIPFKNIRKNFETNFFSTLKIIKKVIKKENKVKIIVMSSLGGKIPMPFCGSYSASKAALTKMIESLNLETKLLNKKIDFVIIEPGLYKTGFNKNGFDKKYDYMDIDSFFKNQIELIKKSENIFLDIFEKRNLDSISRKIVKAIKLKKTKLFYRSPLYQSIFVKIYNLLS